MKRLAGLLGIIILVSGCGGVQKKSDHKEKRDNARLERERKQENEETARKADCAIAMMKNAQDGTPVPEKCKSVARSKKGKVKAHKRAYSGHAIVSRRKAAEQKVESAPPPAASKPGWVASGNVNMPGYYVGIGEGPDWQSATNRAFDQVAAQLKVKVKSETRSLFKEKRIDLFGNKAGAGRTEERTDENAELLVDQTLEGVEIYQRFTDTNRYWILARLSKAKLKDLLAKKLEQARDLAIASFEAAKEAASTGDVAGAIRNYIKAFTALRAYQGGTIKADIDNDGKPEILNSELYKRMEELLTGIRLLPDSKKVQAIAGAGLSKPLMVKVEYNGSAVKRLPLAVSFLQGSGKSDQGLVTDDNGRVAVGLSKVFGKPDAIVAMSVNLKSLCDSPSLEYPALKRVFARDLERGAARVKIALKAARAYVKIETRNLGRKVRHASIVSDIKDVLSKDLGLEFTNRREQASLEVTGNVDTGKCKDFFEQRKCRATARISVKDLSAGSELFAKKVTASGTDPKDDKAAGMNALAKIGKKIGKALARKLKK
ncbi:MAG: hypothetical protein GXP49_12265 [Deltaproteobacteria bacterium]|nr:hypothetical protein [Deltaproteobacteria bacterium]